MRPSWPRAAPPGRPPSRSPTCRRRWCSARHEMVEQIDRAQAALAVPLAKLLDLGGAGQRAGRAGAGRRRRGGRPGGRAGPPAGGDGHAAAVAGAARVRRAASRCTRACAAAWRSRPPSRATTTRRMRGCCRRWASARRCCCRWCSGSSAAPASWSRPASWARSRAQSLARPWAAWLLLVAAIAVLYDLQGPHLRQQVVMLLAWIPVLGLLQRRMLSVVGPWAYLSAVFYLLNVRGLAADRQPAAATGCRCWRSRC